LTIAKRVTFGAPQLLRYLRGLSGENTPDWSQPQPGDPVYLPPHDV